MSPTTARRVGAAQKKGRDRDRPRRCFLFPGKFQEKKKRAVAGKSFLPPLRQENVGTKSEQEQRNRETTPTANRGCMCPALQKKLVISPIDHRPYFFDRRTADTTDTVSVMKKKGPCQPPHEADDIARPYLLHVLLISCMYCTSESAFTLRPVRQYLFLSPYTYLSFPS